MVQIKIEPWSLLQGLVTELFKRTLRTLLSLLVVHVQFPFITSFLVQHTRPSRWNKLRSIARDCDFVEEGLYWWGRIPLIFLTTERSSGSKSAVNILLVPRPWLEQLEEALRGVDETFAATWINEKWRTHKRIAPIRPTLALSPALEDLVEEAQAWYAAQERYERLGVPWTMGWHLYGPPGSGKTSLARRVATKLRLKVHQPTLVRGSGGDMEVSFPAWRRTILGMRPCMVIIEDIDRIYRGDKPVDPVNTVPFDQLLDFFSNNSSGIFFVITSNDPSMVDPALGQPREDGRSTRPGRIDRVVYVGPLAEAERRQVAARMLAEWPELQDGVVTAGESETAAQFQDRCVSLALRKLRGK